MRGVSSRWVRHIAASVLLVACASEPMREGSLARASHPKAAVPAFLRVDQVGYGTDAPKRAFLMTREPAATATFEVVSDAGSVVASGDVGADLGDWSKRFPHVYSVDFDAVTSPGSYSIRVTGTVTATSPAFLVGDPAALFAPLLANSLLFYQTQRDGPNVIGDVFSRQPSHLHDRRARVYFRAHYRPDFTIKDPVPVPNAPRIDVSGGWFDAGDYIKGIQTESYTAAMLLVARRDHPQLLGPGADADFTAELRFELQWLMKMWDDETATLHYMVGFGDGSERYAGDHDPWRLPEEDDTYGGTDPRYRYIRHRPVFRAGPPGSPVSPNLAGRLAAAFGLCSQVYRDADPAFADRCLLAGQHIFDLADTDPDRLLTFSPFAYYPETEWRSDLELGAAELYRATAAAGVPSDLPHPDPSYYLEQAADWARAYLTEEDHGDTLNLYDVSAIAHAELIRSLDEAGDPDGLAIDRDALMDDLERQLVGAAEQATTDPFGFGFPYAAYDGTSHGQGLAITAALYDELAGTDTWSEFGRRQLDVILGANAWGTSFIVGAGTTFPACPHHQIANILGALDGTSPVLLGAAVNGTNSKNQFTYLGLPDHARACPPGGTDRFVRFNGMGARWWDDARSWPTSEPAIDFAATTPLAFAMLMS